MHEGKHDDNEPVHHGEASLVGDPPGTQLLHVELGGVLVVPPVGEVHVLDRGLEGRQLLGDESLCLLLCWGSTRHLRPEAKDL